MVANTSSSWRTFSALLGAGVLLAVLSPFARAQHAAHEHGVAQLNVVVDGADLVLEFLTPLDTLVGFEHEPRTASQRQALAAADATLRDGARLFVLPAAAGCVQREAHIAGPWLADEHDAAAGAEDAHAHARDDEDHAGPEQGHAERVATYHFQCAQPAALDALETRLFDAFPRLREVRAERATARGQGAAVLRPGATVLAL